MKTSKMHERRYANETDDDLKLYMIGECIDFSEYTVYKYPSEKQLGLAISYLERFSELTS